ncbi:MAG: 4-(cytidine 5'-diphospho)-2-C-methyl-D-erythritol kinase [Dehalococcoidia bacterium]|nr:4-(cytidine 5'-diphospho)-2-C-methyl-D-erythritol kinase [Dehalococcoidia bacterium]
MPPDSLSGPAPAKVNLVLEVTGRRADGYHEIDTVLQTLELAGRVTVRFDGPGGVTASGPFAAGTPCDETNLAWRAAEVLAGLTGNAIEGLTIELEKQVPPAGGLGGGASDAATTLRLLRPRWRASDAQLREAAAAVGSDEAFFLVGGTARATGRGEVVRRLPLLPPHGVVLFVPPWTIERKTARMFAALAELPFDDGAVARAFVARPPERFGSGDVFNAFERVAYDVFPQLAGLAEELEARIGAPVRLAGAGPTLFWIGDVQAAAGVAGRAQGARCLVIETRTAGPL